MKTLSVEYAHIYTNSKIGEEHKLSLAVLEKIRAEQKDDISLVVLVDDYSFPDPSFDYDHFIEWLSGEGFKPDVVFRESQLIPLCDEVLNLMQKQELRSEITDYITSKKYPCSLFIAAWYLLRLGHLTHSSFNSDFTAERLINILPASFRPFEEKALEIIKATQFANSAGRISYQYFEGRMIA